MALTGQRTLAVEQQVWDDLLPALDAGVETAWVLLARQVGGPEDVDVTLLVHSVHPVPNEAYDVRGVDTLSIHNSGWLPAFQEADRSGSVPIFVHTHPGGSSRHSVFDHAVDDELARVASVRTSQASYGSLVLGGSSSRPDIAGRFKAEGRDWQPLDRLRVVGERLTLLVNDYAGVAEHLTGVFDRQVRAFGEDGQDLLHALRVGVVGAGGTGSSVVEQLVRLGVGEVTVIDPETLADTNVTRVYGSTLGDAGRSKVRIAADHGAAIGMDTQINPIDGGVLDRIVIGQLVHCDVVFGCTDDNAGRVVLTRLPQALIQLFIDCGVKIDSRQGVVFDIFGRVSVVTPKSACLVCMDDIDLERARTEAMTHEEREQRVREGYAPELATRDPAVITFTTVAASFAVNELLSRALGYCDPEPANRMLIRMGNRAISKTRHQPRGRHRCSQRDLLGSGMQEPFLGYGWSQ